MACHYPPGVRKYEVVGALFGEPYRVARSGTAELQVPESAEIEGNILKDGQRTFHYVPIAMAGRETLDNIQSMVKTNSEIWVMKAN